LVAKQSQWLVVFQKKIKAQKHENRLCTFEKRCLPKTINVHFILSERNNFSKSTKQINIIIHSLAEKSDGLLISALVEASKSVSQDDLISSQQ
jgi:hypothetical protein